MHDAKELASRPVQWSSTTIVQHRKISRKLLGAVLKHTFPDGLTYAVDKHHDLLIIAIASKHTRARWDAMESGLGHVALGHSASLRNIVLRR